MKTLATALLITCLIGVLEPLAAQDMFDGADADGDEVLVLSEVTAVLPAFTQETFDIVDWNADGVLDYEEFDLGFAQGFMQPRRLPRWKGPTNIAENKTPFN